MRDINKFFNGLKLGMKIFGENVSIIVNSVLLSIVYTLGVGITAILAIVVNKKFLEKKLNPKRKSYWTKLGLKKQPMNNYYRQF